MLFGNPWCLQTMETNNSTTLYAVKPEGRASRCIPLEKRSTTTRITMYPEEGGRPVMKSIEASSHTLADTGRGCKSPPRRWVEYLVSWHINWRRGKTCNEVEWRIVSLVSCCCNKKIQKKGEDLYWSRKKDCVSCFILSQQKISDNCFIVFSRSEFPLWVSHESQTTKAT